MDKPVLKDFATPAPQSVLDALPNPVIVVGPDNTIRFANSAAEDFFQMSFVQLVKHRLTDITPFASPLLDAVEKVRTSGGFVQEYSVTVGTPRAGGERMVDLQTSVLPDEAATVVITLQRRSMAQKLDLQLSHQGAARSVSGLAAMLAHEIKNPLSGIRGAAQLMEPALGPEDRQLARLICEETDRIRDLVDQMEVFSDERPLELKPVNIHVVLGRVRQLIGAAMPKGVVVREEYDPSLPPVLGNQDQLVQVFLNLAKNATEALESPAGSGEITFSTAFKPGMKLTVAGSGQRVSLPLQVCVQDNGSGIPEELRPHIFEAFVTSKPQGRGLGLALVAKIVRDHGGVVECVPRERGSMFRILLPMLRETETPADLGSKR